MHILIALCGTSPAILTETIWALAMEDSDDPSSANLPHKIIVLTTTTGAKSIREQLLTPLENSPSGTPCIWTQLRNALATRGFNIQDRLIFGDTSEHLKVFSKPDFETGFASPLDDIRTIDDQNAAADFLLETLRGFADQPNTQITASLAGGRKTMSALLYGCMSLVGRRDDRLTHVLVSAPYDAFNLSPRFYFSEQLDQKLSLETSILSASDAIVELMDVPFVPIRYIFEKQLGNTPAGFQDLVETYTGQAVTTDLNTTLKLDASRSTILYGKIPIALSSKEFAIFHFLATRVHQGHPPYPDYKSGLDDLNEHIQALRSQAPSDNLSHPYHTLTSIDSEDIRKLISSMKSKIKKQGHITRPLANCLPEKGRLSLDYPAEMVEV